jgi:hypothetical protein
MNRTIAAMVLAPAALVAALGLGGCTVRVPVAPPDSGRLDAKTVFVTTVDGAEYRFGWVEVRDSTLVGHYRVEQEIGTGDDAEIVDVDHEMPVPLSRVERLEVKRLDLERNLFLAGSVAVIGVFVNSLLPENETPKDDGNGGKPFPD